MTKKKAPKSKSQGSPTAAALERKEAAKKKQASNRRAKRQAEKEVEEKKARETLQMQRFQESEEARGAQEEKFRAANVSPPGSIHGISPLLEQRRLKYAIPDGFFLSQACNNRVNVFQIDDDEGDTYGDGVIHKADYVKERSREQAPKGILMSAGLKAMDQAYANGYWIGHIINFVQLNPWRKPIAIKGGKHQYVMVMSCGDITDSDDLANYIRLGVVEHARREFTNPDGTNEVEHYYRDKKTGEVWNPADAVMTEEEENS